MLRFRVKALPRKVVVSPGSGQEARLNRLRQLVSGLVRYERIEPTWAQADEARQYAERLIYLAIKNGDKHKRTMELADFWLLEKDLVHKLFKVLVPRYQHSRTSYTDLHKQAVEYPGSGHPLGVLELKGNPWPPVHPKQRETKHFLSNVLVSAARHDYHKQKHLQAAALSTSTKPTISSSASSSSDSSSAASDNSLDENEVESSSQKEEFSSSVDPPTSTTKDSR